jgi:hypothetical protein
MWRDRRWAFFRGRGQPPRDGPDGDTTVGGSPEPPSWTAGEED